MTIANKRMVRTGASASRTYTVNIAMEEKHHITSIISALVGLTLLMWRKRFAASVIRAQNQMWGLHFGKREERISIFMAVLAGIGFLIVGILGLFDFFIGSQAHSDRDSLTSG
jgi:hypothetical protein